MALLWRVTCLLMSLQGGLCFSLLSERWMTGGLIGVVWFITGGGNNRLGQTHGGRDDDGVYSVSLVLCTVRFSGQLKRESPDQV